MSENDIPILEFLDERDVALSPKALRHNLETREDADIPYSTINYRLKQLLNHGLVEKEDEDAGLYGITEKGAQYLAGELDRGDLED